MSSVPHPLLLLLFVAAPISTMDANDGVPAALARWLRPQDWHRDVDGPIVSLGASGAFDDTHIFAPVVAFEDGRFHLWYCGSRGTVAERVFQMGLARSPDGRRFERVSKEAVYSFGDSRHSVLTPGLLRNADGSVLRENDRLRMWFSTTHFAGDSTLHTLRETTSRDGVSWSTPSGPLLKHAYAPTILKEADGYRLWYTDVSAEPWTIRHARSKDGRHWKVTEKPVLELGQAWERTRLFYPYVVRAGDAYVLWYGSYWAAEKNKTAIGCAASTDGITWHKNPHNPVFRPDPERAWESHYTTSHAILRLKDGSWRLWYASRKKPPFVNKYFAIGTARWEQD